MLQPARMNSSTLLLLFLFALFVLGLDELSLFHLKKTEKTLEQIQTQKENSLMRQLEKFKLPPKTVQNVILSESTVILTLATLCDASGLTAIKLKANKLPEKSTGNFNISVDLNGDYHNFISLMHRLNNLPCNFEIKDLDIAKKTKADLPLEIKLKLSVMPFSLPNAPLHTKIAQTLNGTVFSPFLAKRHAGKITREGQTIELIAIEERDILRWEKERT